MSAFTKTLRACIEYREMVDKLEAENAALRELIVKKGYIVTYFNDTIGLACDPYYKPEEAQP